MKERQRSLTILIAGALFLFQFQFLPASASQIRYSWSGQIIPQGSDDPWQIGQQGQPFSLELGVSRDEIDLFDLNVEFAAFDVDHVHFTLNGQEITYLGTGGVDLTDNEAGLFDIFVFVGVFERLGHTIEIGTSVALPLDTFHFTQLVEPPPFFGSTMNMTRSTFGAQGPYAGVVTAATPVFVTPEPDSITPLTAGVLFLILAWRETIQTVRK